MDKITDYQCAIGGIEEIKEGNIPKVDINLHYLKSFLLKENEKRIAIPKVIGIYQKEGILLRKSEGVEDAEEDIITKVFTSSSLRLARLLLEIEDNIDSSLISIIYDNKLIPEISFIKQYLDDKTGRVAIKIFDNIPDFGMKNTAEIPMIKEMLAAEYRQSGATKDLAKLLSVSHEKSKRLRNQMISYGLTSDEYTYLAIMEFDFKNKEKTDSKIYKPCSVLSELIDAMSKKNKNKK